MNMIAQINLALQSIRVGFIMALMEMRTHIVRSILSMSGIMLGVASLVIMLTLIGGIDIFLNDKMVKWVGSVWFWKKYDPPEDEKISWSRSPGMRLGDAEYLKVNSPLVKDIPLSINKNVSISLRNKSEIANLWGIEQSALALDSDEIKLDFGSWLEQNDFTSGTMNCVISWEIAETMVKIFKLQSKEDVLGRSLKSGRNLFTIKGVYGLKEKNHSPWHYRRGVLIPIKTMLSRISGYNPDPGQLTVQLNNIDEMKRNAQRVATTLKENHRGIEDFEYRTADWLEEITKMLNNVSILMGVISLLSLSAGGLSIMNVMLSSISERIREIGTRKALGANNFQIFIQFITETTTLSIAGGSIGMFLGCIPLFFKKAILQSTDGVIEPTILLPHLIFTTVLIVGIGLVFGLYPALKAIRMNPVDALRYE